MADGSITSVSSLKGKVSAEEWQARVDLAALYRLVALYGWDDAIYTHISARLPGPDHQFLINPYGMYFGEMTASALVKIDLDGNILQETPYFINPAGFTIHSAIHAAREDAHFVMHLHTDRPARVARVLRQILADRRARRGRQAAGAGALALALGQRTEVSARHRRPPRRRARQADLVRHLRPAK